GVGAPTHVSFTVPTASRRASTSNGAHSRRWAGSVSACQTFSGEWRSSLTRTSATSLRLFVLAPHWPAPVCIDRDPLSFSPCLLFSCSGLIHTVQVTFESVDVTGPEPAELSQPGIDLLKWFRSQPVEATLCIHRGFDEPGLTQYSQM